MNKTPAEFMSVAELARRLGVCPDSVRMMITTNELPASVLARPIRYRGQQVRLNRVAVEEWMHVNGRGM